LKREKKIIESERETSGKGFDHARPAALEVPENLFDGAGVVVAATVHCSCAAEEQCREENLRRR